MALFESASFFVSYKIVSKNKIYEQRTQVF